jgi:hypothetical protein
VLPKVVPSVPAGEIESSSAPRPDLYEFLGLAPFESSPEVISSRVRNLMREARKYQVGPYAERTQSYMESIASATACLLDPRRKGAYDEELRRRYGLPEIAVAATYHPGGPVSVASIHGATRANRTRRRRGRWHPSIVLGILVFAGLAAHWLIPATTPDEIALKPPAPVAQRQWSVPREPAPAAKPPHSAARTVPDRPAKVHPESPAADNKADLPIASKAPRELAVPKEAVPKEEPGPAAESPNDRPQKKIDLPPADSDPRPAEVKPKKTSRPATRSPIVAGNPPKPSVAAEPAAHHSRRSRTGATRPAREELTLNPPDVLRELRAFRLKRNPAQHLSSKPHALSTKRIVELVRYARTAFADNRSFQRALDHETTALKRLDPKLKRLLPDSHR